MEGQKLVKRLVPIDLVFASRADDKYFRAPLVAIAPYMEAIRSAIDGREIPETFHTFNRAMHKGYDSAMAKSDLRSRLRRARWRLPGKEPVVETLSDDRLLIGEGLLDACIAKAFGREWIHVRMPEHVAAEWDSRPTQQLDAVCAAQQRTQIYAPVMHPAYRKFKYSRPGRARLDMMREFLGPAVEGMTLLDIGCNGGYYAFHFRRQGMKCKGIDIDVEHLAVAEAQAAMYGLDVELENVSLKDFNPERPYDIVLALSVLWHVLGWGRIPAEMSEAQLTAQLDKLVGTYLFWESGPEPEREIELIRNGTGLTHYERLGTTSATGVGDRAFGVFSRR